MWFNLKILVYVELCITLLFASFSWFAFVHVVSLPGIFLLLFFGLFALLTTTQQSCPLRSLFWASPMPSPSGLDTSACMTLLLISAISKPVIDKGLVYVCQPQHNVWHIHEDTQDMFVRWMDTLQCLISNTSFLTSKCRPLIFYLVVCF